MAPTPAPTLRRNLTPSAQIVQTEAGAWHLEIPAGPIGRYRLAQLDDYASLQREDFPWQPPLTLTLGARASAEDIPGTWGFGLWNDPFSLSLGLGGAARRLPSLPNAAWFFFASPPNYLSLRDDLPAQGALAATFRSLFLPAHLLTLGVLVLPLFFWSLTARHLRRLGRRIIQQDAAAFSINPTEWHTYSLTWHSTSVSFQVDGKEALETTITPIGPMGLVLWVDNQYAALPPTGRLAFGTLPNPEPAWIEIENIILS